MRISDWSSDVCSSDLDQRPELVARVRVIAPGGKRLLTRQAAEDEQARPLIDAWRKGAFAQALAHRHIAAGGILDGRIFRVAAGDARAGRGHQLARVRPDPFHPVRPPTPLGFAGLFDELVKRRRFSVECPILVFSGRWRIDDARDMARSGQSEEPTSEL